MSFIYNIYYYILDSIAYYIPKWIYDPSIYNNDEYNLMKIYILLNDCKQLDDNSIKIIIEYLDENYFYSIFYDHMKQYINSDINHKLDIISIYNPINGFYEIKLDVMKS